MCHLRRQNNKHPHTYLNTHGRMHARTHIHTHTSQSHPIQIPSFCCSVIIRSSIEHVVWHRTVMSSMRDCSLKVLAITVDGLQIKSSNEEVFMLIGSGTTAWLGEGTSDKKDAIVNMLAEAWAYWTEAGHLAVITTVLDETAIFTDIYSSCRGEYRTV